MNVFIVLIGGAALIAIFVLLARSLQQPDPLEESTRSHRLARPGDEPVFLVRTTATEAPEVAGEVTASKAESTIS